MADARALILDFGGVISKTLFETHDQSERALGLPAGSLSWRGPFDPDSDPLWTSMQRGDITERGYWLARAAQIGALAGERWTTMAELVRRVRGAEPLNAIRPEALDAIDAARARGARLAILSNELDLFYGADFRDRLSFLAKFDVICDATYTEVLKPDPRAYLECSQKLSVPPGACVYLDDQPRNVEGARAVGMHAICLDVRSPGASFAEALARLHPSPARTLHA